MRHLLRRTGTIAVATAATLAVVGVSVAAYSANGSGVAAAKTAKAKALTLEGNGIAEGLFPGSTAPVELTITNPNPYPVEVTALNTSKVEVSDPQGGPTTCSPSNFTLDGFEVPVVVPAGGTAGTSGTAAMAFEAADDCQDVVVGFFVDAVGAQTRPPVD